MKLESHLIKEAFEKSALKLSLLVLSVLTLSFAILLILDLTKEPILIERGCETELLKTTSQSQTKEEVNHFLEQAVQSRFNTKIEKDPSAYLIQDLLVLRKKEQTELKNQNIDQKLIVRKITLEKDLFIIEADRLIAVEKVRSAIPTQLIAKIASKERSLTNPYGLILTSIEQVKEGRTNE